MSHQKTYRVVRLDGAINSLDVLFVKADGDDEAVTAVETNGYGIKCEIWDGQRLVATLESARRTA